MFDNIMLLAFQAIPSGSTCSSGLICGKMASTIASTMATVSIDASGPVSFFKRKLVRSKSGLFVTVWSQ